MTRSAVDSLEPATAWFAPLGRASGLGVAVAAIVAIAGYCLLALSEARHAARAVDHHQAVVAQLRAVGDASREAAEAVRLQAETGDQRQVQQHRAAVARATQAAAELRRLVDDEPLQQRRWAAVEQMILGGLTEASDQLERRAAGAASAADRPDPAAVDARERRRAAVAERLREMLREEGRVLSASAAEAERKARTAQVLLLAGTGGSLALILAVFALMRREAHGRLGAQAALRQANAGLQQAVAARAGELRAESEHRRRESELLQALVERSTMAIFGFDPKQRTMLWNPAAERMFGYAREEVLGQPCPVPPHGADEHAHFFERCAAGEAIENVEMVRRHKDGRLLTVVLSGAPLYDREGSLRGMAFMCEDVTRTRAMEEQLRQAQKMEAVGQLTGGVAHDFNNLLLVIQGSLELVDAGLDDQPELRNELQRAIRAGERGATLTRGLLAFARKQPLAPSRVDIDRLVGDMVDLLRRALGEAIEIKLAAGAGLWPCQVDAGQLQNALINLAVNARDAMPGGGKLTIETDNAQLDQDYAEQNAEVVPGDYVLLAVSDTGSGMPPEVVRRAFDPFFTTKQGGRGSGLGLSMVYGFVKQSGGHVKIYSELDHGTTIKLYLPRSDERAAEPAAETAEVGGGGHETVLVVEDDTDVRALTVAQLAGLGYVALQAASAEEGLDTLARAKVDLLLTDVVLSGSVGGRELAERATARQPGLRVLFMSGYTEDAILHHGRLDPGIQLLQKPFRKRDLAAKVRSVLGT